MYGIKYHCFFKQLGNWKAKEEVNWFETLAVRNMEIENHVCIGGVDD